MATWLFQVFPIKYHTEQWAANHPELSRACDRQWRLVWPREAILGPGSSASGTVGHITIRYWWWWVDIQSVESISDLLTFLLVDGGGLQAFQGWAATQSRSSLGSWTGGFSRPKIVKALLGEIKRSFLKLWKRGVSIDHHDIGTFSTLQFVPLSTVILKLIQLKWNDQGRTWVSGNSHFPWFSGTQASNFPSLPVAFCNFPSR